MPEKTIYKLSPMQQGMLFHSLAAPHSGIYLQQLCCRLRETLNVPAFIRAWDRVVERHAIFRTSFSWDDPDGPQQQVHDAVNLPFEQYDYRELDEQAQTEKLDDYLQTDRRRGFDFSVAPLMRFALFRLEEDNYYLVWTFHHALMDGRSRLLVLTEVFAIYEALCDGREQSLPQPRPFSDFIAWLEQQDFSRAERFWREQLKGFTASTPLINSRSLGSSTELGEESVRLPAAFTTLLHSFAEQHELTVNTILQGAWALLLNQYSREPDVVFGITRAGRRNTIDGVDSMVGIFINTLPLRIAFSPQRSLLSLLKELRTLNVTRREYEHTPLTKIQEWSELPKGAPLFESLVVFENYHLNSLLRALLRNREFELIEKGNFPLTVLGYGGSELLLKIAYQQARFEQPQIARLLRDLESALKAIVTNPRQSVGEFSLITDEERRQMLVEWNQTQVDYPENTCIHQLFETQVERNPESIALSFGDKRITYRELNERDSQLAHYLQSLRAGVETLVGIHLERSVETVVAILAVLKAGGAYVPLAPTYPASRLEMMIADSGLSLLLTREAMLGSLALEEVVLLDLGAEVIVQEP